MPSKIEKELTPEQVVDLLEELQGTEGGTRLKVIQDLAAKRGVKVSLMSASSFRDGKLEPHLAKLKKARDNSLRLAEELVGGEEGGALAGSRLLLAETIMDFIAGGDLEVKDIGGMAKALGALSTANQGERMTSKREEKLEIELEGLRKKGAELLQDFGKSDEEKVAAMRGLFGME